MKNSQKDKFQLILRNRYKEDYFLRTYSEWGNLQILQEQGGKYAIYSNVLSEFCYDKIEYKRHYILAYFYEEISIAEAQLNFHIYCEQGLLGKNGEIQGENGNYLIQKEEIHVGTNGFVTIPCLNKKLYINKETKKAYSVFHFRYWIERLKTR